MMSTESRLSEVLAENERLRQENQSLKTTIHEMQITKAATERADILRDAMLPLESIRRLNDAFKSSTDNAGLKQALNAERRHTRSMTKQDFRVERILGVANERRVD